MRLSTRKIVTIELTALLLVVLLDFLLASATVREYAQAGVLGAAVLASALWMGWYKPRENENKVASLILILAAAVFQLALFVLLGFKLGFVTNVYRFNWMSLLTVFLPLLLLVGFMEILRGQMVDKGRRSRGVILMTAVVLSFLQIAVSLPVYLPLVAQSFFELILTLILPVILTNILLTYVAYSYDYRANIAYRLIMELPIYLLPIYPDVNVYFRTLLNIVLTLVLIIGFMNYRKWGETEQTTITKRQRVKRDLTDPKKRLICGLKWIGASVGVIIVAGYVALMSGLFHYYFLAVGSGSMEPAISRGDLVLVEKTDQYDQIAEGDILIYWHKNIIMVHRVSDITYDGKAYHFTTKGDANITEDTWQVEQGDIIGVAKNKIAIMGYPTLWLNEILNGGK